MTDPTASHERLIVRWCDVSMLLCSEDVGAEERRQAAAEMEGIEVRLGLSSQISIENLWGLFG